MPNKPKRELFDMSIDEISMVDKAANKRKFLILKSESEEVVDIVNAFCDLEDKEEVVNFVKAMQEAPESVDGEYIKKFFPPAMMSNPLMAGFMQPQPDMQSLGLLNTITEQLSKIFDVVSALEAPAEELEAPVEVDQGGVTDEEAYNMFTPEPEMIEKNEDSMDKDNKDVATPAEEVVVEKSLDEQRADLQKEFDDKMAQLEADRVELEKAKEEQRMSTLIAKAEKLAVLGVEDTEEVANVLKSIEDADSELLTKVEDILNKAVSIVDNADLLKEEGGAGEDVTLTDEELIANRAAEICKADSSISREKAYVQAHKEITNS